MNRQQPYRFWTKHQLLAHLLIQAREFGIDEPLAQMVFSIKWNPITDFDGCTLISDRLQPFLPCFVHDYEWITGKNKYESDKKFRRYLIKCGVKPWLANLKFAAVRIAALTFMR
jgi:hypothetical protein